ncbi:MAG: RluA family pseudouridine synthase [Desulfuromonadales bacterium]
MAPISRFVFGRGRIPQRLDLYLAEKLPEKSRSQIKKLIEEGRVTIDGTAVRAALKLRGGEELRVDIPEAMPVETLPENIPLEILYQDSDLIVINKPAGMVVHPAAGHHSGTLVNALLYHCRDLSGISGELRPGIVHRLDKDTSGVMVAAKNDAAHQDLSRQFKLHSIARRYVALVCGLFQNEMGTIDSPLGRHPVHRKKMSGTGRTGRRAVTHWQVRKRYDRDRITLVELALETGRTHQIRVHLAEMNRPILGDPVYSRPARINALADTGLRRLAGQLGRQALHARLLGFTHPATGEDLNFEAPLPEDMQRIVDYLEGKYQCSNDPELENNTR